MLLLHPKRKELPHEFVVGTVFYYFCAMAFFHFLNKNNISKESFEAIYKTYYSRLYYYSFQFIADEETSKDIVNDVFEKIWLQRDELKADTLSSYLYTLVRNRCLDHLRHQKVEQQYAELYKLIAEEDIDDSDWYEERMTRIEQIIAELGEPTKGIFTRCYFQHKKYAEVAQEYHISSSGVKKHIMKVLRLIREKFDIK